MASEDHRDDPSAQEMRQRLTESQSLQRVTTALLQRLTLEQLFDIVRQEARQLTGAEGGSVFLLEENSWLREARGDTELDPLSERIPVAGTLTGQAVLSGKPVTANNYVSTVVEARTPSIQTASLLAVPLQIEGVAIGALNVANKAGGFTDNDVRILALLADVAAIAIENARLRSKSEQLAIVEERQWLARELHDSVTQAMYSVTLYAEATRLSLLAGKNEVAQENLKELQTMAHEALFNIRLLIFELHPPILEGQGLSGALKIRLSAVETRAGLETDLHVEGDRRLQLSVEEEIYRIVLEALNNVVKHARARRVTVRLLFEDRRVLIEIADDGKGYDPVVAKASGGMGLRGMQERANRLDGKLEILSAPGQGTTLKMEVAI